MKKLKDAAIHWADTQGTHPYSRRCAIDAFTDGGKWMREEMTRWHDPREELPRNDARVLCKVDGCAYTEFLVLNWYDNEWWIYHLDREDFGFPEGTWVPFYGTVLSWREIHE